MPIDRRLQGCGVGVRVGVARSRGNEPGVGVGVDQAASTPTPGRLLQFDPVREGEKLFFGKIFDNIAVF